MNVVIDCNIFISAVLSQNGMAIEVLRYTLKDRFTPQFGEKLFCEYEDVLSREHIASSSKLSENEIEDLWEELENGSHILMVAPRRVGKTSLMYKILDESKEKDDYPLHLEDLVSKDNRCHSTLKRLIKSLINLQSHFHLVLNY